MRHGYGHHMGLGFYGSYILIFFLLIILTLIFFLLKNQSPASPFIIKQISILKEKYASGTISVDEYTERKSIIENTKYSSPYTPMLLERYAECSISTEEFLNIKNEIESNKNDSFICEQLAKGELSYNKFKLK
ncbi:SHOCT domain-containing protein [Clostridium sp. JS66]|uniref:SHOCT domain-containing protein n=1 Tax=Clostridium sp. JS66 TaxID=3064705 RepID=UPI00298D7383|nr:SHOCT domain-containing protein [Clostridium sp. JS66]WPC43803.1 SHOCT domain-containing protein [Clostridium sp. JS66]